MPRLPSIFCFLLAPTMTVACQATVNVTGATETETDTAGGDGGNSDTKNDVDTGVTTGPCIAGDEGCHCYANETCNGGLACEENVCQQPPGVTTGTTTDTTTGKTSDPTPGDTSADTGAGTNPNTTGGISTDTASDTSGNPSDDTSSTSGDNSGTTGDTTGSSDDSTTGDVDPGCGKVPADMACVPANSFQMGTDFNTFQNWPVFPYERPAHTVTISKSYWIDLTEVTVEDYAVCWALKVCKLPKQGPNLNWGVQGKEKHPANGVTWYDAKQYCE